jgi:FlaA1/EpsC-like NDP-sugar epimerase
MEEQRDRIMVIGAGSAGQIIVKELLRGEQVRSKVCCIIDDNPTKKGKVLEGIPIVGNRYDILRMVEMYKRSRMAISY